MPKQSPATAWRFVSTWLREQSVAGTRDEMRTTIGAGHPSANPSRTDTTPYRVRLCPGYLAHSVPHPVDAIVAAMCTTTRRVASFAQQTCLP